MHLAANDFDANVALFIEMSRDRARVAGIMEAHRHGRGLYLRPTQEQQARDNLLKAAEASARTTPATEKNGFTAAFHASIALNSAPICDWWLCVTRDRPPERRVDGDEYLSAEAVRDMVDEFAAEGEAMRRELAPVASGA